MITINSENVNGLNVELQGQDTLQGSVSVVNELNANLSTGGSGPTTATSIVNALGYTPAKSAKIGEVTLLASAWIGDASPYSQVVSIDGVTENSQVDLTPSVEQLAVFYEKDLGFVTENDNGVVTVYAIGQKPTHDYTIQVTITEVDYE